MRWGEPGQQFVAMDSGGALQGGVQQRIADRDSEQQPGEIELEFVTVVRRIGCSRYR